MNDENFKEVNANNFLKEELENLCEDLEQKENMLKNMDILLADKEDLIKENNDLKEKIFDLKLEDQKSSFKANTEAKIDEEELEKNNIYLKIENEKNKEKIQEMLIDIQKLIHEKEEVQEEFINFKRQKLNFVSEVLIYKFLNRKK